MKRMGCARCPVGDVLLDERDPKGSKARASSSARTSWLAALPGVLASGLVLVAADAAWAESPPAPTEVMAGTAQCTIRGTVFSSSGQRVAGAQLRLEGDPPRTVRARTSADGGFVLKLEPGWSQVVAEHRGTGAHEPIRCGEDEVGWRPPLKGYRLVLERIYLLEGTVSLQGRQRAPVRIVVGQDPGLVELPTVLLSRPGRFHARVYGPGLHHVLISSEGFASYGGAFTFHDARRVHRLDVRLKPGEIVRGVVRRQDGAPVADARVEVSAQVGSFLDEQLLQTDARGGFQTTSFSEESGSVRVHADGYRSFYKAISIPDEALELELQAAPVLRFRISEGGRPIEGARVAPAVKFCKNRPLRFEQRRTDDQGRFRVRPSRHLDGEWVAVQWEHAGGVRTAVRKVGAWSEEREVEVELEPAMIVGGLLHDGLGVPVEGAWVVASWNDGCDGSESSTAADGSFSLAVPRAGQATVATNLPGTRTLQTFPIDGPLLLRETSERITGRVVDPAGKPVAGASVNGVSTDARGRFSIPSRGGALHLDAPGHLSATEFHPVQPPGPHDLVLHPVRVLRGRLRDRKGKPPSEPAKFAVVVQRSEAGDPAFFEVEADATGEFAVRVPRVPLLAGGLSHAGVPLGPDVRLTRIPVATQDVVLRFDDDEDDPDE